MKKLKNIVQSEYYQKIMFIVILGYAFTYIQLESVGNIFRAMLILGSVIAFISEGKNIVKDPIFIFLALSLIIPILSWLNGHKVIPDIISNFPKLDRLPRILTFFFVAYWLKASYNRIYALWFFFILGLFLACLMAPDFSSEIKQAISGIRIDFGIKNAQFTSMLSGIAVLISLFSIQTICQSNINPSKKTSLYLVFFISLCISIFITIVTQSRQVWLSLSITFFLYPLYYAFIFNKKKVVIPTYICLIIITLIASQSTTITSRIMSESETIQAILSGKMIPMTSIGIRVNSWIEAYHWIYNAPIFGSSSEAISQVIERSDIFNSVLKSEFHHLHNYYIEILVAYGLIGLSFILSLYYWVIRSIFIYRSNVENDEITKINHHIVYSCCLMTFWAIINFFETFNSRSFGVFTQTLIFASIYTFYLHSSKLERLKR